MVRVEEIGQFIRNGLWRGRRHAEHEQRIEARRDRRGGNRNAKRHSLRFGHVEIKHPLHALVDSDLVVAGADWRCLRIGSDGDRPQDVQTTHRDHRLSARLNDREPAIGHQPRHRRATPRCLLGVADDGGLREYRRMGQWLVRRGRGCRPLRTVRRLQRVQDPRAALVGEAIGELPPRGLLCLDVIAGAPYRVPRMLAPLELAARELSLVRIDVNLVRIDPHAQLAAAAGLRKEASLQSYRQQGERLIARAKRVLHRRWQRSVGKRQREARSEWRRRHRS